MPRDYGVVPVDQFFASQDEPDRWKEERRAYVEEFDLRPHPRRTYPRPSPRNSYAE